MAQHPRHVGRAAQAQPARQLAQRGLWAGGDLLERKVQLSMHPPLEVVAHIVGGQICLPGQAAVRRQHLWGGRVGKASAVSTAHLP